jgi:hypothetical protein
VGVFSGSVSLTKFYVRGTVPKRFAQRYIERLSLRCFSELAVDAEEDEQSGWCVAGNPMDLELSHQKVFFNDYLVAGLRVDKCRIPRPLLKAQLQEAMDAFRERTGRDKLNKKDKDELKFRVERKLRKKVLPSMRQYDFCWNLNRETVLFWSRSPRVKEEFQALFEQTFELELDEESPYMTAKSLLAENQLEAFVELSTTLPIGKGDG